MPLDEYSCQDGGRRFEKLTRLDKHDDKAICLFCGSSRTQRAISLFATSDSDSRIHQEAMPSCAPTGGRRR